MGSSIRNFLLIQHLVVIAIFALILVGCGEAEDPVVEATGDSPAPENFGVAYLKRRATALNLNANQATNFPPSLDVANGIGLTPGDVYILDLSSGESVERNITSAITAPIPGVKSAGDVSDLEVSYDGRTLIFSMHEGMYEGRMPEEQPTWNIWVYDVANDDLQQLIVDSVATAEIGNDVDPHFLPDGRIVFTSDRRAGSRAMNRNLYGDENYITINERNGLNSGQTAYALHIFDRNAASPAAGIKQISFNQSNDLNPTVLDNGKILFSRWEGVGGQNQLDLFTVNPDGSELDVYYGAHSHGVDGVAGNAGATLSEHYADFKQMPDGTLIGMLSRLANSRGRSKVISIDQENFFDFNQKRFTSPSLSTEGHTSAIATPFLANTFASLEGNYITPHPIYEPGQMDRVLISRDNCRVQVINSGIPEPCNSSNVDVDSGYELAEPLYSIYIHELDSDASRWVVRPEQGIAIVNPVALVNRPISQRPRILVDKLAPFDLNPDMETRGVGAISIKSVYDTVGDVAMEDTPLRPLNRTGILTTAEQALFPPQIRIQMDAVTGNVVTDPSDPTVVPVDRLVADIATIRDPALTTSADQRVPRFVRISKAVPKASLNGGNTLTNDDFGRTNGYEMREILGYTVVEPDGSVYVEVPANVPFTIDVLDAKGRSFMSHTNWMQVIPGEVRVCGGCHSPNDGQAPINIGAETAGPFPNTLNTMSARVGETMAEARAFLDCPGACEYAKPKRDIVYDDVWTDETVAGRPPDASVSVSYDDDPSIVIPLPDEALGACDGTDWAWRDNWCRLAINYPDHIQPIWDAKCVFCHNDDDPNAVPPGNLVLETQLDATSPRLQAYYDSLNAPVDRVSYEFLFSLRPRMEQDPAGGRRFIVPRNALDQPYIVIDGVETVIAETDIGNLPFSAQRPRLVRPGAASARHSHLIEVLSGDILHPTLDSNIYPNDNPIIATPTVDHTNLLSEAEMRLLIEWIDNGTQYYNDLVDANTN